MQRSVLWCYLYLAIILNSQWPGLLCHSVPCVPDFKSQVVQTWGSCSSLSVKLFKFERVSDADRLQSCSTRRQGFKWCSTRRQGSKLEELLQVWACMHCYPMCYPMLKLRLVGIRRSELSILFTFNHVVLDVKASSCPSWRNFFKFERVCIAIQCAVQCSSW
jgi:hypothetical protein